jgi:hypothetical protein
MRFNPFAKVDGKYGAPMGRHRDFPATYDGKSRLYARHCGGDGTYDRGGALLGPLQGLRGVDARRRMVRLRGGVHARGCDQNREGSSGCSVLGEANFEDGKGIMKLPVVNNNGTSRADLLGGIIKARRALAEAIEAVGATAPHGRDFQFNPEDYRGAVSEHADRMLALRKVMVELDTLGEHIA